jgi:hypothetical protein
MAFSPRAPIQHLTAAGSSADTVVAALFHNVGQFLPASLLKGVPKETDIGSLNHASIGSVYLVGLGFPVKVTTIVA